MKAYILTVLLIFFLVLGVASAKELNVTIVKPGYYSDIWLGVSTGGYKLIAEKNSSYAFRIFIKNGMSNRSLHNVGVTPNNCPFEITSIDPKGIEQLKPMEIRIYNINASIPENASGRYPIKFDVYSDEFPVGVFSLESEIKVVKKIRTSVYVLYAIITFAILLLLFYRKFKQSK